MKRFRNRLWAPPSLFSPVRTALEGYGEGNSDLEPAPGGSASSKPPLMDAAVLVPLIVRESGLNVILTKRSPNLTHHAGQISFPGGRLVAEDSGPQAAALREAGEEIGIQPEQVEFLGRCPIHNTVTGFRIFPFVAAVSSGFEPVLQAEEVESVFEVPFQFLVDPANFRTERVVWKGRQRRYYAVPYGPHYIWGATAAILLGLARRIQQ